MSLTFIASECGFADGVGGASNTESDEQQHYVLFGKDGDGVYFEFDDQMNGGTGQVRVIHILPDAVTFDLNSHESITVKRGCGDVEWNTFLDALRHTYDGDVFASHNRRRSGPTTR